MPPAFLELDRFADELEDEDEDEDLPKKEVPDLAELDRCSAASAAPSRAAEAP
jgi:hypothetical protein